MLQFYRFKIICKINMVIWYSRDRGAILRLGWEMTSELILGGEG